MNETALQFRVRVTRLSVLPVAEPLWSEKVTTISIMDESAGEFVEIEQQSERTDKKSQTIQVGMDEWPAIKQAVDQLLAECEPYDATATKGGLTP